MIKPYGAEEFDGYPMVPPPKDQPPLSDEEQDRLITEALERIKKKVSARETERSRKIS